MRSVGNCGPVSELKRGREIVIRTALGAGRWRIVRQLLTESILIALLGGALGVLFAWWGTNLLISLKPQNLPRLDEIGVDLRVFGFTLGVSFLTGLIFGLLPAWSASRGAVNTGLKESGQRHFFSITAETPQRFRCRRVGSCAHLIGRRWSVGQDVLETAKC